MSDEQPLAVCPESPEAKVVRLRAQVAEQAAQIVQLLQRVQELEVRLAKDSHNSSKPPFKMPPPRTLRQPSGQKPGGQKDHPGATLALVADPEHTVTMPLVGRCACGQDLSNYPSRNCPSGARSPIW